jgi:thioredoxin-related protein
MRLKNSSIHQKLIHLFFLFFVSVISLTVNAQTEDPMTGFFHQSFGDLSDELSTAIDEGKKGVFIMFDDKDCPWCGKMKATILNQKSVQDYFREHFRMIRIDSKGDVTTISMLLLRAGSRSLFISFCQSKGM